jgi:hypothetical protein
MFDPAERPFGRLSLEESVDGALRAGFNGLILLLCPRAGGSSDVITKGCRGVVQVGEMLESSVENERVGLLEPSPKADATPDEIGIGHKVKKFLGSLGNG